MKKILVIGCPGSGKSTFSKALHAATGIPLFHLDMLYWNADKTTVKPSVFHERLAAVLQKDTWIVDGNYSSTMELRMQACDTVVFLDYPLEVCLGGVKERKGKKRNDMPFMESEEDDVEFLDFIRQYRLQSRPQVTELLHRYAHKQILVFKTRAEADAFLAQI